MHARETNGGQISEKRRGNNNKLHPPEFNINFPAPDHPKHPEQQTGSVKIKESGDAKVSDNGGWGVKMQPLAIPADRVPRQAKKARPF